MSEKLAIIMRGMPGSGKTTFARKLCADSSCICSTDDYFMLDGRYQFDPSKLAEYHDANFAAFTRKLQQGKPVVACDNTNSRHWEYDKYVRAARKYGYVIVIVAMPHISVEESFHRNTHGIPMYAIQNMLDRWED